MISLAQLRTFLEIARLRSIGEAADQLAISQPAVSAALAALQRELGVPLVERSGRGIRLTAAGTTLADYGHRIFALLNETRESVSASALGSAGRLRVAAVTTAAEYLVPEVLRRFREGEAGAEIVLEVGNHERVWERLAHWEVDVVFAGRPPQGARFHTIATRAHELVVIGPGRDAPREATLGSSTWLVREAGSGSRAATYDLFARLEIAPPQLTVGSNGAILASVAAGLGLALVSADAIERDLSSQALRVVPTRVTPIARNWHLVKADRELPEIAKRFIAFVTDPPFFVPRR